MSDKNESKECCPCPTQGVVSSFATVLNKDLKVTKLEATPYKGVRKGKFKRNLPLDFNPMDQWGFFLTSVRKQGNCGACWAMATAKALSDRISILSLGGLLEDMSPYVMVACEGTIFPGPDLSPAEIKRLNLDAHTAGACNGNTLTNAMDFLYTIGCVTTACVNQGLFADYNIPNLATIEDPASVPICQNMLGPKYETCLDRNKAARFYRTIIGYEVENNIEAIKTEIFKWGPVVGGMRIYDNFTKDYDGVSIYMGPKPDSKSLGGHAVEVCGWGREGNVDYWWICNSWGSEWGMSGFFRMKMGECELEQNIVSFIPDFPGFTTDMIDYDVKIRPELEKIRQFVAIDPITGYQQVTIPMILSGQLKGDLQPIFNTSIPDMTTAWLGDFGASNLRIVTSFMTWQKPRIEIKFGFSWTILIVGFVICALVYFGASKYFSSPQIKTQTKS